MAAQLNEFSYNGSAGEFIEIRVDAGESVTDLSVEIYTKSGSIASLSSTVPVSSGTMTSDGTYDYYVLSVPLENGPRAGIALIDEGTNPDTLISSVVWGSTSPVTMNGGSLDGSSQSSIGTPLSNSSTTSLIPDGMGNWIEVTPTSGTANICFASGCLLDTPKGLVLIEDLRIGDLVCTQDHGNQPVRWIGSKSFDAATLASQPNRRPIRIKAHALGPDRPDRDMLVSRQHRMMIKPVDAGLSAQWPEVLCAAIHLTDVTGVDIADDVTEVEYFHLMFDQHEIVTANNTPSESLWTGDQAMDALGERARQEIFAIFPELANDNYRRNRKPARVLMKGGQSKIIAKHLAQNMPLC